MPKERRWCTVHANQHGYLFLRLYHDKEWKEGLALPDTSANRKRALKMADRIAKDMKAGKFKYLRFFPNGNRATEFRAAMVPQRRPVETVESFFDVWIENLGPPRLRLATVRQYRSSLKKHVLPHIGQQPLHTLIWEDLAQLQTELRRAGVGPATINRALHHALRSMLQDARRRREIISRVSDLFDPSFWQRLDENSEDEPDPYDEGERSLILDYFRRHKGHFFAFVSFSLFQGTRPSETVALRRRDVDLRYGTVRIHRSRVASNEAKTKTRKSKRTIRLHSPTIRILRDAWPIHANPDDYVFTTPTGAPIDQGNFYKRIWLPALRKLGLRERAFYNCRHSYISYLLSLGKSLALVSAQTGHSIRTLERHYKKYLPQDDDLSLPDELSPDQTNTGEMP